MGQDLSNESKFVKIGRLQPEIWVNKEIVLKWKIYISKLKPVKDIERLIKRNNFQKANINTRKYADDIDITGKHRRKTSCLPGWFYSIGERCKIGLKINENKTKQIIAPGIDKGDSQLWTKRGVWRKNIWIKKNFRYGLIKFKFWP
jgi:hypothetical protein